MLEVHADVYNLNMHTFSKIQHDRLTINRLPNYRQIVNVHGSLDRHTITAEATIDVPAELTKPEDIVNYAKDYLVPYHRLLSFAQNHDVFFNNFRVIEVANGSKTTLYSVTFSIQVGDFTGANIVENINEFINVAIPLLKNKEYAVKTGLEQALILYNEGAAVKVIELELTLFFVGLETLANAHWANLPKSQRKPWLFDEQTWSTLSKTLEEKLGSMAIEKPQKARLLDAFGNLQDPPIRDKLKILCVLHGLPDYSSEVSAMHRMRNDVLHGRPLAPTYGGIEFFYVMSMCERLLVKLLLKCLNYYRDWPDVHGSITNTDVSAIN